MFRKKQIIELLSMMVGVVLTVTMSACAPRSVREAEKVVTQADSLWQAGKMYGVDEGDSASLAQAYETLQEHSAFSRQLSEVCPFVPCTSLLRTYSHACYHYGKLLRAKGNPVEAMQVFIAATHSHTRDYHILGRVYNNIGDICHLAGDYQLSYDMFERSANTFLNDKDTLSYYYCLNDMAFEMAEQGKKEEVFSMLSIIDEQYPDPYIHAKTWETKAELYRIIGQYDSAIYCVNKYKDLGYSEANTIIIMAQAYDELGKKDSALVYAQMILADSSSCYQNRFNALYIASHYDSTLCASEISELNSQREDIRYYEYEPQKEKWNKAVQVLEQDLNKKPDLQWVYAIIATIVIIGTVLLIYIRRKHHQHQLLSQQVDDLQHKAKYIQAKHEQIVQEHKDYTGTLIAQIEQNCIIFSQAEDFPNNICWKDFSAMSKIINENFGMLILKLQNIYHLQEKEIRLCILVLLAKYNGKQIAKLLFYAESGVRNFKSRVANKLGTNSAELHNFLINLAINEYSRCTLNDNCPHH